MKLILCRTTQVLSWIYLFVLIAWSAAYLLAGDRIAYLGLVNLLAVYLFFPLPLVLLVALLCKQRDLLVGFAAMALIFMMLWGPLFLPPLKRPSPSGPTLSVMTFNVLAWHDFSGPIIETIRAEDPDILFIQELNYDVAETLERELGEVYPYRALEPTGNPSGIGTFSKLPIRPVDLDEETLVGGWIGGPIVLETEWEGRAVTLVNFHMLPTTGFYSQERTGRDFEVRAEQARVLAEIASRGPAILGGDANSGPISDALNILTGELQDAWRAAGWGLGHTFPGSAVVPGSDRPRIRGVLVPPWLARIDYILCTQDWKVVSAGLAKLDGVSDHRGVVAVLRLKDGAP